MDFPQYRKYKNGKSYFKITSTEEFEEYQLQFGRIEKHYFKASILPDRNFIADMLVDYHDHWEKVDEEDLQHFLGNNADGKAR